MSAHVPQRLDSFRQWVSSLAKCERFSLGVFADNPGEFASLSPDGTERCRGTPDKIMRFESTRLLSDWFESAASTPDVNEHERLAMSDMYTFWLKLVAEYALPSLDTSRPGWTDVVLNRTFPHLAFPYAMLKAKDEVPSSSWKACADSIKSVPELVARMSISKK